MWYNLVEYEPHKVAAAMLVTSCGLSKVYKGDYAVTDHTTRPNPNTISYGYCHCGCGQLTPIAKQHFKQRGWIKGEPIQFIQGHNGRKHVSAPPGFKTCAKCGETKPATTEFFGRDKAILDGLKPGCKACQKAYRAANAERDAAYYATSDKEQRRENARVWRANHPEELRTITARRRARKRNAEGSHTAADIERQYKNQKGRCYYCSAQVGKDYHADHVIPLSRGGSNGIENIVIACQHCNVVKHDRLPHEWAQGGRLL